VYGSGGKVKLSKHHAMKTHGRNKSIHPQFLTSTSTLDGNGQLHDPVALLQITKLWSIAQKAV
jgi:ribosomal protein S19